MDPILFTLVSLAALGAAIVGGIFYGFSSFVMRGLTSLGAAQGVAAMNAINRTVITPSFLGVFIGAALLAAALVPAAWIWWPGTRALLVAIAAALYLIANFGVTMVFNQPMNLRLAAMPAAQAQAFWPRYVRAWSAWNHVRTAASLLAAALFVGALVIRP